MKLPKSRKIWPFKVFKFIFIKDKRSRKNNYIFTHLIRNISTYFDQKYLDITYVF